MTIGVIGLGDVGQAITKLCVQKHQVFGRDLDKDELGNKQIDILHICIPGIKEFENITQAAIKQFKPRLTIINSTVKPGTTQSLYRKTNAHLVHAPIIGVHPYLYQHLKIFTKPLGATSDRAYNFAQKHFQELGVKTVRFDTPFETELAKIFSTTYYTWNILFEKWLHSVSQKHQANFNQVYIYWNQIYNSGYSRSHPNVIRPILKHFPGKIGGHCLIPNIKILHDWLHDSYTQFILKQNKTAK